MAKDCTKIKGWFLLFNKNSIFDRYTVKNEDPEFQDNLSYCLYYIHMIKKL